MGVATGYAKMQADVSNTKAAVDKMENRLGVMENRLEVLYQRALWEERGHAGPPAVPLTEEAR